MRGIRTILALPFWLVSGIAFLLLGLQLILAALRVLAGTPIIDSIVIWVQTSVLLAVVAFVAGFIGAIVGGGDRESS